ncbi:RagB/SusD family nutrient uptake outer membrane protein [Segetibacter koreensis]|uniref:RagB/SusD family nutrient uptake outer membrane protein n=1 Tax=Segetibacter koreensis TaxID=398037 RepID=UPI0003645CD4|nr:RagB/SusD family nutrient uptake outer membrane protein [Segetibacter koreensis]
MKRLSLYISLFCLLLNGGCNKYLDKEPDNRVKLNTPEKVSQLLGTAYPQANYQAFAETMTDNVTDIGSGDPITNNVIHDPYFFVDSRETQEDSPENYWDSCYAAVAAANQALETISKVSDPENYKAQKGEALVARAYAHFMLVNFFSKFYDASTASTDPGIPYVTSPETIVFKKYERKTVQYVYDMVEKDLLEGLPLIEDKIYNVPKYHFNHAAANAFAARFYLYKKDYPKVIQYANEAVPGNFAGHLRGWNSTYQNITDVNELFKIYAKATEPANLLLQETKSYWSRYYYTNRYGVSEQKQSEIFPKPDPLTGGNFAFKLYSVFEGTHELVPKIDEYFVKVSVNANIGDAYVMVPLFTTEEVLFNRAEAYTYTGNITGAISDLNTYASTRINNYSPATNTLTEARIKSVTGTSDIQVGLIRSILFYKRAEFIHEGMRWFDILRYKIPVVHTTKDGQVITLSADDLRRVLQLPQSTSLAGLEQNPR